jgi:DNA polymerase-3 subunit beta
MALRELARVAGSKSYLPVLPHVLLRATDGTLTLTATDLTQRLTYRMPADGGLNVCLPAKLLAALTKPEGKAAGDVILEPQGNQVSVQLEDGVTRLTSMDPTVFPAEPHLELSLLAVWPSTPLQEALSYVLPAVSTDPTRPHLRAVHLDADHMITTDGHRMHLAPLPSQLPTSLLLPAVSAASIMQIAGAGDQVFLAVAPHHLRVGVGQWQLDTKLVDGVFPPHHQVVPKRESLPTRLTVETRVLTRALSRLDRLSSVKQTVARVNGVLTLTTSDPDLGESEVVVPTISNTHQGDDLVAAFDRKYLHDAISTEGQAVELGFSAALDPLRVDLEGERVAVIMPMRA